MNILSAYKKSGSVIINSKETGKSIRYKKGPLYRGSTVCNLVPGVLPGPQVEDNLVTRFTLYVGKLVLHEISVIYVLFSF